MADTYHIPVMAAEVVAALVDDPAGTYLDATAGGGGHCRAILAALAPGGRLMALDRDAEAVAQTGRLLKEDSRFCLRQAAFDAIDQALAAEGIDGLHGALFDLGVSSRQIDAPQRGFSYRHEGPLDMRMDGRQGQTAAGLLAACTEAELTATIRRYGEERQARRIARAICRQRDREGMQTTEDLRRAVASTRPQNMAKTLARVFQALRIAVNDEMGQLEQGLKHTLAALLPGGRLVTLAYHSLEDRLVKQTLAERLKGCICPPALPICACGRQPEFARLRAGITRPAAVEVEGNPRARSARMRGYRKL